MKAFSMFCILNLSLIYTWAPLLGMEEATLRNLDSMLANKNWTVGKVGK